MIKLSELGVKVILLDIEGTTTPIEFVHSKLFGYAKLHYRSFLEGNFEDNSVASCIDALHDLYLDSLNAGLEPQIWRKNLPAAENAVDAAEFALFLTERDSKAKPLKELQGMIWRIGFEAGELEGDVYPDVLSALKRWKNLSQSIYIYSSGSVLAQRLIFGRTSFGDISGYISGYFDTAVGNKRDKNSYLNISKSIGTATPEVVFLSDVEKELEAAEAAGMRTILVSRERSSDANTGRYSEINSFDEVI